MTEQLEEGYRALGVATVHDMDDNADDHRVVFDFDTTGNPDAYRTGWQSGVWDESWQTRPHFPMVFNHDPNIVIGSAVTKENLGDRARVVNRLASFRSVPKAEEVHSLMADGHLTSASYHFRNGLSRAHPSQPGVRLYTRADMMETSPVTFGSALGNKIVDVRSDVGSVLEVPSIDEMLRLAELGVIAEAGLRSLISEHYPLLRDHITIVTPVPEVAESQQDSGTGTRDEQDAAGGDEDSATLAAAVDAALDEAANLLDGQDLRSLPDPVQQALALVAAAGVAVDELLDVMGIDDPDGGDRAQLSSADTNDLPDTAFAYIEPGGMKDGSGKTAPRSKRHFPVHDAAHARNALAQASKSPFGDKAMPKILAAARKFGIETGQRSGNEPDEQTDAALDADLARVADRLARYR